MNLDAKNLWATVLSRLPPQLQLKIAELKTRFMAAGERTRYAIIGGGGVFFLVLLVIGGNLGSSESGGVTFTARRGNLDITVLEGGAMEALQSQEVRSEVRGREGAKILSIVEEGYRVTPEDVAAGLILVELDTSSLIEQRLNQEISVETAEAQYIEKRASYEIQLNRSLTDLNAARQEMKFSRLDFEKFLGANVVGSIITELGIEERLARAEAADRANLTIVAETPDLEQIAEQRFGGNTATAGAPSGFDPTDLESMPPQMQERMRQMMAENGGQLPAEMLERLQSMRNGGGFPPGAGGGGNRQGQGGGGRGPNSGSGIATADSVVEETGTPPQEPARLELVNFAQERPAIQPVQLLMDSEYMLIRDRIDFTRYAKLEVLEDGEAKQSLRTMQDEVQVAREELLLAQERVAGQRRLEARGFITPTELEAEELRVNKSVNRQEETETAMSLYIRYSFPKDADKFLADYENAVMAYQRTLKENIAEEAQEAASLKAAEKKLNLESEKLRDINNQIAVATIRATRPGLVVYGGANQNPMGFRGGNNQEAIQEGATVSERQPILTIPDMREMAVKVNIHETAVKRLAAGQLVKIKIDAFPGQQLTGVVTRVAVVADSAASFMNPDLKVYPTVVKIDGIHDWLRPGMSAEVDILVETLENVVYVPLQAVSYFGDQQVVYVSRGGSTQRREVQVGAFSEQFIEIVSGLQEGEQVLLLAPQGQAAAG